MERTIKGVNGRREIDGVVEPSSIGSPDLLWYAGLAGGLEGMNVCVNGEFTRVLLLVGLFRSSPAEGS